jgi:manganese transport protein
MGKSLEEVNESVSTLDKKSAFRILAFFGPAYLISVGYMDPETGRLILQEGASLGIPYFGFIDE